MGRRISAGTLGAGSLSMFSWCLLHALTEVRSVDMDGRCSSRYEAAHVDCTDDIEADGECCPSVAGGLEPLLASFGDDLRPSLSATILIMVEVMVVVVGERERWEVERDKRRRGRD